MKKIFMSAFIAIFTASCSVPTSDSRLISTPLNDRVGERLNEPQSPIPQQIKDKNISSTFIDKDQVLKQKAIQDKLLQKKLNKFDRKPFSIKTAQPAFLSGTISQGDSITTTFSDRGKLYKFYGKAGQVVKIKLSELDAKDAYLRLYPPNNFYQPVASNDDTFGLDSYIEYTLTQDGYWSILASTYEEANLGQAPTGAFELSLNNDSGVSHPVTAMNKDGQFVIAWQQYDSDGSGWNIYAKIFDKYGNQLLPAFKVNETNSIGSQFHPSIAITKNKSDSTATDTESNPLKTKSEFVITWQGNGNGDANGIFMKKLSYDFFTGAFNYYPEFRLNTETNGVQENPAVAINNNGEFVIAWDTIGSTNNKDGIYIQKVSNTSVLSGNEILVNQTLSGYKSNPKISLNQGDTNNGDFVVVWQGNGSGDMEGVYERRYNIGLMNALDPEYRINSDSEGYQANPAVSMSSTGKFVMTWQTNGSINNTDGIYMKVADNNGLSLSAALRLNVTNSVDHSNPAISINQADGIHNSDCIIGWNGIGTGDETGVYERKFNVNNLSQFDPEFRMNYLTNGVQTLSAIGMGSESLGDLALDSFSLEYSRMVQVWQTRGSTDGTDGIYALRVRNNNFSIPTEFKVN